ncbi:universal stress protein [Paraburkholderia sp. C35]|uniref:universal stress protein n=1 Tax=Paraburkholderia sp. C35 TaxID=2126993 RepID=UPI000D698ABC|nr:universal stress protein [Paraburkholderia sp. C35]
MSKHILVAVGANCDGSVLKTAIEKARHTGARLTAVYVVDTMPWWAMTGVEYGCIDSYQLVQELEREVERRCNETLATDAWDIQAQALTVQLGSNSVGRRIARLADELDADMIVGGAGHGSKWRFWEERMSDVVGRCTRRSVLVATSGAASREEAAGESNRRRDKARAAAHVHAQTL